MSVWTCSVCGCLWHISSGGCPQCAVTEAKERAAAEAEHIADVQAAMRTSAAAFNRAYEDDEDETPA